MRAPVDKGDSRSGNEILDRARYQDLARVRPPGDAGADMDRDAAALGAHRFALAGVHAGTDLEAEGATAAADRLGTADGAGRPVEGREKAVARGVDLAAAEALELAPGDAVEAVEQLVPARIAELCRALGRADDIGEQDRRRTFRSVAPG
jgi:hypothetical protein